MFPDAHSQPIANVTVQLRTKGFHTSYLEVVNPPSNELVKLLYFITVADTPTTTSEFFHPFLKLCYRFCMWFRLKLMRS